MNAITVTRDYGAGGYEVAGRLAQMLSWELLDRELLHRAALIEHLPDAELERLDEKAVRLMDRLSLHPPHQRYIHGLGAAAHAALDRGNVVLVGRGTGRLLAGRPGVFHLRLVASLDWRAQRMARKEGWSLQDALARCTAEDRTRERFTRYFFGDAPFHAEQYHLTVNTGRMSLEDVAACVSAAVRGDWPIPPAAVRPRVLTLSRQLAAAEPAFAATLAATLGLRLYDRELLEQEAVRLGVTEAELALVDEHAAGFLQRHRPGSLHQRYAHALTRLMKELAGHGDVLLVGRGGNRLLADLPAAFHVRLVAPLESRVRQVMEEHWLRDNLARQQIEQSDKEKHRFFESCFGADWADPLEYHLTVNAGWLGESARQLVNLAARRHWSHLGRESA
jgi:cytidylate kinase